MPSRAMGAAAAAPPRAAALSLPVRVVGVSLRCTLHRARLTPRASRSDGLLANALEAACCLQGLVGCRAQMALCI